MQSRSFSFGPEMPAAFLIPPNVILVCVKSRFTRPFYGNWKTGLNHTPLLNKI
jgi:hypothetical protein